MEKFFLAKFYFVNLVLTSLFLVTAACAPAAPPSTATPTQPTQIAAPEGKELVVSIQPEGAIDLAGEWRYQVTPSMKPELFSPDTDDSDWPTTQAPARWSNQNIQSKEFIVVVYRRIVKVPVDWQGKKIGISAWFYPGGSALAINGQKVQPDGPLCCQTADVSQLLKYGQDNLIAVSTTLDGVRELSEAEPPRLGFLSVRPVTKIIREDINIPTTKNPLTGRIFYPQGAKKTPVVIFAGTTVGSHSRNPVFQEWQPLNEDLARQGYVSLALMFQYFEPSEFEAALKFAQNLPYADPQRIVLVGAGSGAPFVPVPASQNPGVRGVVLISSEEAPDIARLGEKPVLFIASQDELDQLAEVARKMAGQLKGKTEVLTLIGNSSSVEILDTNWNVVRSKLLEWLGNHS